MQRRRLLSAVAAGLATGVAGCSAPRGNAESAITDVEWLDGDALDADTLADRHATTLVDVGSFELFSAAATDHDGEEPPENWLPSQEYEAAFEADHDRQYLRQEITESGARREVYELYVDGDEAFVRERVGDEVTEDRQPIDRSTEEFRNVMREESLSGVGGLDGWNMTVADRSAELDGERTVRLTADEFGGDAGVPESVASAEATMYATSDGVVPRLDQRWEGTHRGQGATAEVDISFRDIGTATVTEPEWVAALRDGT